METANGSNSTDHALAVLPNHVPVRESVFGTGAMFFATVVERQQELVVENEPLQATRRASARCTKNV